MQALVARVVPWVAVATAGAFNALAMRYKEIERPLNWLLS